MSSFNINSKIEANLEEEEIRSFEVIKWETLSYVSQKYFKFLIQQKNQP